MSLTVSMSYLKDQEFEFTNNSNNSLIVDMYDENLKKNHSPMELLLSALTSCAAVEIVSMIKKRRRDFKDLKAITTGFIMKLPSPEEKQQHRQQENLLTKGNYFLKV